jgi:hypothetical protein
MRRRLEMWYWNGDDMGGKKNEPLFLFLPIYAFISVNCGIKFRKKLPGI